MKKLFCLKGLVVSLLLAVAAPSKASELNLESGVPARDTETGQSPRLLSAFFGLDNDLPFRINLICVGGSGKDGMPVVFSQTLDADTLEPEDFQIVTASGKVNTPRCVTLNPARDASENRTVLLIGEFGDAPKDPPTSVKIVGELLSDGTPSVDFNGAQIDVTPLAAGPSIVLAQQVAESVWTKKSTSTACPKDSAQVIRVTWNGGVKRPNGDEPGDEERKLYRVTVDRADGSTDDISPAALAELDDNDNNHFLCLDTADPAVSVH